MKMCVHSITAFMTAAASGELALSPDYTASGGRPSLSFSLYSSSVTASPLCFVFLRTSSPLLLLPLSAVTN